MAKVKLIPGVKGIQGKGGDMVFRTSPNGKVFVSKAPDMSKVEWSPAKKEQRGAGFRCW